MRMNSDCWTLARRFSGAEDGLVAVMFAIVLAPMLGLVSVALDYAGASRDRAQLQSTLDAAALALARSPQLDETAATALVQGYLSTNYTATIGRAPTVSFTRGEGVVSVQGSDRVPRLMPLLISPGSAGIGISASSEVRWGLNDIEIALVLDNTGSMASSNKMNELKRALCGETSCGSTTPSSGFVKIMRDAAQRDGQFKVALVPFDTVVRMPLGVQQAAQAAMPVNATLKALSGFGYCTHSSLSNTAQRVDWFRFSQRDRDPTAASRNASNQSVGAGCGTGRGTPQTWQGCVWDRDLVGDLDVTDRLPGDAGIDELHPAVNCETGSLARILPLVDIRTGAPDLIASLRQMTPSGPTNLTIGVTWGMAVLSRREPFTEAREPANDLRKFMILLTDGENTESKHSTSSSAVDDRARRACAAAKADGITIYAIRVIDGDRTLLSQCASSAMHYKEVANAAQLTPVFEQIAREIGALRIAR